MIHAMQVLTIDAETQLDFSGSIEGYDQCNVIDWGNTCNLIDSSNTSCE